MNSKCCPKCSSPPALGTSSPVCSNPNCECHGNKDLKYRETLKLANNPLPNPRDGHPCLCNECLSARDAELARARLAQKSALRAKIEGMRKMGGEFGFCKHCKFHKGDYEHDFGTCAAHDKALDQVIKLIDES